MRKGERRCGINEVHEVQSTAWREAAPWASTGTSSWSSGVGNPRREQEKSRGLGTARGQRDHRDLPALPQLCSAQPPVPSSEHSPARAHAPRQPHALLRPAAHLPLSTGTQRRCCRLCSACAAKPTKHLQQPLLQKTNPNQQREVFSAHRS